MIAHHIHSAIRAGAKLEIEMATLPKEPYYPERRMIRARMIGSDITTQDGWGFSIRAALVELEENIAVTKEAMERESP